MPLTAYLLLDLDVGGGRVYYFTDAPEPQTVTDQKGNSITYAPGLAPIPLNKRAGQSMRSVNITIAGTAGVDWAEVIDRGAELFRSKGLLRRWYTTDKLEVAEVWARGFVTKTTYGAEGEDLVFALEERKNEGGVIPSADMLISAATWPVTSNFTTDEAVIGQSYPMIFGRPTGVSTPCYMIEYRASDPANCKLMIAGHLVEATSITLHDVQGEVSATRTVQTMQDKLGRQISYVDFSGVSFAPELNREYRAAWDQNNQGGLIDQGTQAMWGAGDIAGYLLRRWSDIDVDWGRWSTALDTLNAFKLGFAIIEPTEIWGWVQSDLLPLLPGEWVDTTEGGYIQPWNLSATARDSIGHIDISPEGLVSREGSVSIAGGRIANEFSVMFAFGGTQYRPQETVTVKAGVDAGGAAVVTDSNSRPNLWCRISKLNFGERRSRPLVAEIVYDKATANLIAKNLALRHALPRRSVKAVGPLDLDRFRLNDTITVQADDLYWTAEPAQIRAKEIRGDSVVLTLLLLEPFGTTADRRTV